MDSKFKIISLYALTCLIWGGTWLAIRICLVDMTPFFSAGIRFILAAVFIYLYMAIRKVPLPMDRTSIILYLVMSIFSFLLPFGLVYWGEKYVPSGLAAVLFAIYPFVAAILSYFFLKDEKIGKFKIIGMILSFAGIVVIFSDQFGGKLSDYFLGMIAITLSGVMQASIAVTIKKFGQKLDPLSMNLFPMGIGGVLMVIVGFLFEDYSKLSITLNSGIAIVFLAFFGSIVTFTSYYWLLKRINIILLSLVSFITPIIALILGWALSGEKLITIHFIGSFCVLGGIFFAVFDNLTPNKVVKQ
ncbi:MAG: EamA family transporter [Bacteroidota bacterium]|nr:EamA family transporter [Bacteroidota bacterium]